jgi:hypothetical protein
MPRYDLDALDRDLDYAPGLSPSNGYLYWRAPPGAVKAGFAMTRVKLPGKVGDGQDRERARRCRDYAREVVRFLTAGPDISFARFTWGWVIRRYLTDEFSPFRDVKANTRDSYREVLERWESGVGNTAVGATDYLRVRTWLKAMKDNGRSVAYIKRMVTHLRIVTSYGVALGVPGAAEVKAILSELRVRGPAPRSAAPTAAQITAIIAKADEAGAAAFALGLSIQWWLALRAVDVRGQWLRMEKGEVASGITRGAFRWADGLTWDMLDRDLTTLRKVPSKTEDDLPDALTFDLRPLPDLRARLMAMPHRVGPVIVDASGLPYRKERWSEMFRTFRAAAGVPDHIWMMDTRAGAITDAKRLGASKLAMQFQANHASGATTERYIRERSASVNEVIRLRTGTLPK